MMIIHIAVYTFLFWVNVAITAWGWAQYTHTGSLFAFLVPLLFWSPILIGVGALAFLHFSDDIKAMIVRLVFPNARVRVRALQADVEQVIRAGVEIAGAANPGLLSTWDGTLEMTWLFQTPNGVRITTPSVLGQVLPESVENGIRAHVGARIARFYPIQRWALRHMLRQSPTWRSTQTRLSAHAILRARAQYFL